MILTNKPFYENGSLFNNCELSFANMDISLTKIDNEFVNEKDSLIYIRSKDHYANNSLLILLNGEKFSMDMGRTNGYGTITKEPKRNRKLINKLKAFYSYPDKYTLESYKGYEAYKRFGYKNAYGVWVINSK